MKLTEQYIEVLLSQVRYLSGFSFYPTAKQTKRGWKIEVIYKKIGFNIYVKDIDKVIVKGIKLSPNFYKTEFGMKIRQEIKERVEKEQQWINRYFTKGKKEVELRWNTGYHGRINPNKMVKE